MKELIGRTVNSQGRIVISDTALGRGGEGSVYSVLNHSFGSDLPSASNKSFSIKRASEIDVPLGLEYSTSESKNRTLVAMSNENVMLGFCHVSSKIPKNFCNLITVQITDAVILNAEKDNEVLQELILSIFSELNYSDFAVLKTSPIVSSVLASVPIEPEDIGEYLIWHNPDKSHYTYRIYSKDSDKYYYGVRSINVSEANEDDCLKDSYMGSGGYGNNKFNNWKKFYRDTLEKEVIQIFAKKHEAYTHEKDLIGDRHKTDSLCLNSIGGGRLLKSPPLRISFSDCEFHGSVKHLGDQCYLCRKSIFSVRNCSTHGEVLFRGERCLSCTNDGLVSLRECSKHGLVKHRGPKCYNCSNDDAISFKHCSTHGIVKHIGNSCCSCRAKVDYKDCSKHGLVLHHGDACCTCESQKRVSIKICDEHGETKHRGEKCYKCIGLKQSHSKSHLGKDIFVEACRYCKEEK